MDEVIILSDESEEDSHTWRSGTSSPTDIIDLTDNGEVLEYVSSSDDDVIDLAGHEDVVSHGFLQNINTDSQPNISSLSEDGVFVLDDSSLSGSESFNSDLESDESNTCRSKCSSESTKSCLHECLPEHMAEVLPSTSSMNHITGNASPLQEGSETRTQVQQVTSSTPTQLTAMQEDAEELSESECDLVDNSLLYNEEASESESNMVNKSFLYKCRYYKKLPVTHLLRHTNSQPTQMPLSRMNLLNSAKDEGFHQGTLYFLSEFVSASHYPPRDVISHVINTALLGAEEQTIRHEAYVILMKVQRLHPATSESVAWQWNLLSEVMSKQEYQSGQLFLQYVVQTLDDDFHLCLQRRALHKSLCKCLLSCNESFCNVKQVAHWLIDVVKQIPDTGQDSCSQCNLQRTVFLLQRMLSIAVDVDSSPTMNSNKMAGYIFHYVMVLKTRQQRELFFTSAGNILLRAKILELIFQHGCTIPPPPELSLCFGKILYFISNSTLDLETQGPEWQKWDEILHHFMVLCLSLQTIITDHLRTPVVDRTDEIVKRPRSRFCLSEGITESEVDRALTLFKQRTALGAQPSGTLLHRLYLLRSLLFIAVKSYS